MRVPFRSQAAAVLAAVATLVAASGVFAQTSTTILSALPKSSNTILLVKGTNLCGPGCAAPVAIKIGIDDVTSTIRPGWTATDLIVDIPAYARANPGSYKLQISATTAPGRTAFFEVRVRSRGR